MLATSRHVLGIEGEHVLPVLPLPVPGDRGGRDALELFADRAAAAVPGFSIDAGNRAAVERLCRRLEGMPLALELAAVRLRALSPEEICERLDDAFRLLTTGPRAAAPHQRTLRATIEWSHRLCSAAEQVLWARLSVFPDEFGLDVAEEVCAGDGIDRSDVFELLAGLVDKSILRRESGTTGRHARFRLLDTLRLVAGERLVSSGEEHALRTRHRDYFRRLAARARPGFFGQETVARSLELLDKALAEYRALNDEANVADVSLWMIMFCLCVGDARADKLCREYLAHAEAHGALREQAYGFYARGLLRWRDGDLQNAGAQLGRSVELFQRIDDQIGVMLCLGAFAWVVQDSGDSRRAATVLGAARAISRRSGTGMTKALRSFLAEKPESRIREALGEAQFEETVARGAALGDDEAVRYALRKEPSGKVAPPRAIPVPDGLTRRENEVAALVAQGMTNREIAEHLVISQRTAEAHVEHILTKLGFRSRAQIAGWVADHT